MTTQGLRQNWRQFSLLVVINAFVGAMVGLERSILPDFAESEFGIETVSAILSFIAVFGVTKAITNYYMGSLANRAGRRNLLIWGWIAALPVPIILIFAQAWLWVIFANILLGINQGLCWSSTVVMKIDLAKRTERGLAVGLNESSGYTAIGIMSFVTGWLASRYGLRPEPFYLGIAIAVVGLLLSVLFVRDTARFVDKERMQGSARSLRNIFWETTWKHGSLGAITQAGMANNLNDGMMWGLLPILLGSRGFTIETIGMIAAIYPLVWGISQAGTGFMSDKLSRKAILTGGMLLQGIVLLLMAVAFTTMQFIILSILLGLGTALVYPTFIAAISDYTVPEQRAESIGVFRFWRDMGYAAGAIASGIIADLFGLSWAVISIGLITILSATIIVARMKSV